MGSWGIQTKSKNIKFLRTLLLGLFLGALILPLAVGGCSKKSDPDVEYGSDTDGSGSSGGDGDGDGSVSGTDLGDTNGGSSSSGMKTVYFDYDSSALTNQSRNQIKSNIQYLKANKGVNITIEGHCDDRGSTEYNLALGERRANAVRDFMVNLGISQKRLRTISYGEERPAKSGSGESAWSKNRRSEFVSR
jgi:peptidoglycan-associated lipoprotein